MRLEILKTYKLYIGGKFPRTESGRYYPLIDKTGKEIANVCLGSRKDFRNAVVAARGAFGGWSGKTAFNRSQILYRIAEMLEGRRAQFIEELITQGSTKANAEKEVNIAIDRLIYYAGWADKYLQVFSSVNPVSSSHFNFSGQEPMGVITVVAPENEGLLGLVSTITPVIASGNTCVVLASESKPLTAISFAEVLNSSDVPGGVVNLITGKQGELIPHFVKHMDVNAILYTREDEKVVKLLQEESIANLKRILIKNLDWFSGKTENPYLITDFTEVKTTWHPIEQVGGAGSGY